MPYSMWVGDLWARKQLNSCSEGEELLALAGLSDDFNSHVALVCFSMNKRKQVKDIFILHCHAALSLITAPKQNWTVL